MCLLEIFKHHFRRFSYQSSQSTRSGNRLIFSCLFCLLIQNGAATSKPSLTWRLTWRDAQFRIVYVCWVRAELRIDEMFFSTLSWKNWWTSSFYSSQESEKELFLARCLRLEEAFKSARESERQRVVGRRWRRFFVILSPHIAHLSSCCWFWDERVVRWLVHTDGRTYSCLIYQLITRFTFKSHLSLAAIIMKLIISRVVEQSKQLESWQLEISWELDYQSVWGPWKPITIIIKVSLAQVKSAIQ